MHKNYFPADFNIAVKKTLLHSYSIIYFCRVDITTVQESKNYVAIHHRIKECKYLPER
jgi:hypothetical protein